MNATSTPTLTEQWLANPQNYQYLVRASYALLKSSLQMSCLQQKFDIIHGWIEYALSQDVIQHFYNQYANLENQNTDFEDFICRRVFTSLRFDWRRRFFRAKTDAMSHLVGTVTSAKDLISEEVCRVNGFYESNMDAFPNFSGISSEDDMIEAQFSRDLAEKLLHLYKNKTSEDAMLITRVLEGVLYSGLTFFGSTAREGLSKKQSIKLQRSLSNNPIFVRILNEARA